MIPVRRCNPCLSPPLAILSLSDAKLLVGLCHQGKLYEIEKWISDGKSLHLAPECKTTPLQVALDCGFHSLVELLALLCLRGDNDCVGYVCGP